MVVECFFDKDRLMEFLKVLNDKGIFFELSCDVDLDRKLIFYLVKYKKN